MRQGGPVDCCGPDMASSFSEDDLTMSQGRWISCGWCLAKSVLTQSTPSSQSSLTPQPLLLLPSGLSMLLLIVLIASVDFLYSAWQHCQGFEHLHLCGQNNLGCFYIFCCWLSLCRNVKRSSYSVSINHCESTCPHKYSYRLRGLIVSEPGCRDVGWTFFYCVSLVSCVSFSY